jgi:1-acyl-sn-glycerol-3-phosphate acyltransferase
MTFKYARIVLSLLGLFAWDFPYFRHAGKVPEKSSQALRSSRVQRFIIRCNQDGFHMVYVITGQDQLPDGQLFFTPNHVSISDPIALLSVSDRPVAFLAKKEVSKMPYVGDIVRTVRGHFIDRMDLRSELKVYKEINKTLDEEPDLSYIVFPEGTRAKPPLYELGSFHPGSFRMAMDRGMPIVPVAMYFTERVLSSRYHYHQYPVQIAFLPAIMPKDYENLTTQQVADKVKDAIEKALVPMRAKDPELVKTFNHYSDKKLAKVLLVTKTKKD